MKFIFRLKYYIQYSKYYPDTLLIKINLCCTHNSIPHPAQIFFVLYRNFEKLILIIWYT